MLFVYLLLTGPEYNLWLTIKLVWSHSFRCSLQNLRAFNLFLPLSELITGLSRSGQSTRHLLCFFPPICSGKQFFMVSRIDFGSAGNRSSQASWNRSSWPWTMAILKVFPSSYLSLESCSLVLSLPKHRLFSWHLKKTFKTAQMFQVNTKVKERTRTLNAAIFWRRYKPLFSLWNKLCYMVKRKMCFKKCFFHPVIHLKAFVDFKRAALRSLKN